MTRTDMINAASLASELYTMMISTSEEKAKSLVSGDNAAAQAALDEAHKTFEKLQAAMDRKCKGPSQCSAQ